MDIVVHSFRLLFSNLANALKVSIGPYLLAIASCLAVLAASGVPFVAMLGGEFDPATAAFSETSIFIAGIACFLIVMFASGWVAVAWHRFVLLEEYPGLLPSLAGRPVWPYVGRVILLSLLMLVAAIPLGFLMGLVAMPLVRDDGPGIAAMLLIGVVTGTILSYLWMRLGLILPAVAVGRPITMGESWAQTSAHSGAIFVTVLVIMALNIGVGLLFEFVMGPGTVSAVLSTVVDWISIMVGISVLTTLYGVIVERRPLG